MEFAREIAVEPIRRPRKEVAHDGFEIACRSVLLEEVKRGNEEKNAREAQKIGDGPNAVALDGVLEGRHKNIGVVDWWAINRLLFGLFGK